MKKTFEQNKEIAKGLINWMKNESPFFAIPDYETRKPHEETFYFQWLKENNIQEITEQTKVTYLRSLGVDVGNQFLKGGSTMTLLLIETSYKKTL